MENNKTLEKLLNNFFNANIQTNMSEVSKTEKSYIIELLVPGISKDQIDIKLNNKLLLIKSEKENKYIGKLEKKYILPDYIDFDNINASVDLGLLKLELPIKIEKSPEKKIEIF